MVADESRHGQWRAPGIMVKAAMAERALRHQVTDA